MSLRILLADDHQLVRQGVRALLEKHGMRVVAECCNGREAVQLTLKHTPDVAVLDMTMPELNGIDAARQILEQRPGMAVVLLTFQTSEPQVVSALRVGIRGYVLKTQTSEDLVRALHEVAARGTYLSPGISQIVVSAYLNGTEPGEDPLTSREREVLQLVAEGKTTKEVAGVLGLSAKTAESYRGRLMQKLQIHETAGLVRYAIRQGLIQAVLMLFCLGDFIFDPSFTDFVSDALNLFG